MKVLCLIIALTFVVTSNGEVIEKIGKGKLDILYYLVSIYKIKTQYFNPSLVCPDFAISIRIATNILRSSGGYIDIIFRICIKFCRKIPPFNMKKYNE